MSNTAPYAFFGPRPLTVTHGAGLDTELALTLFRKLEVGVLLPAAMSAMARGRRIEHDEDIVQLDELSELTLVANGAPFPWQVDGDYLGEVARLEIRYEPDVLTLAGPLSVPERDVGHVGDEPVDPGVGEPPDLARLVDGPDVERELEGVGPLDDTGRPPAGERVGPRVDAPGGRGRGRRGADPRGRSSGP